MGNTLIMSSTGNTNQDLQLKRLAYIGDFLRQIRLANGMTQNEVCDDNDIPRSTLQKAEYGNNLTLATLFQLIDAYELSPEDFFIDME